MSVSSPFVRRPIATSLLGLATVLAGWLGYMNLPVSSLPQVDFPTIQVTTQLPGANPDTMATLVTAPLERQLGQIPALSTMTSSSSLGLSQITLQFNLSREIDAAAQDVQAAINAAGSTLPRTLPFPPTYSKVNPADAPIMTLALTSDTVSQRQMSDLADTLIAQRMSTVSGVGHVTVEGGIKPAVRIQADLSRLAAYSISMSDLRAAIIAANVSGPKGSLDGPFQTYTISANDQITSAQQYRNVIVTYRNGAPILLSDVAEIVDGLENTKVGGWYQGQPAIIIDVQRQPGANVIDTVTRINKEIPRLQAAVPQGVKINIVHDRTSTIRASIHDVQFSLVLAVGLVVLVVLAFLRSIRATIIAGVALPVSLIATFGVMWICGFSLDNLSLMALTIGTGFVVDDAIVMIENIVRHIEEGEDPLTAALDGAREIGFTVISLTLSLIAVFIPLLFMTGLVGRMFREFALTLTIAVIVSAVVSLTLTPMMCAKLLKSHPRDHDPVKTGLFTRLTDRTIAAYGRSLELVLRHQTLTLMTTVATLVLTIWLYVIAPKGFLPLQDTGMITGVMEGGPEVSFEEMERLQAAVTTALRADPDVSGVVAVVGVSTINPTPNAGQFKITLKPRDVRKANVSAIITNLQRRVGAIPGATVYFQPVQDVQIATRVSPAQYQYTLVGTDTADINLWGERLVAALKKSPVLREVISDAQEGGLRALIRVDREVAGRLGVSMQAVNDALNDAFGQRQISTIYAQANQYRVVLEASPRYQSDPAALSRVYVPGAAGAQVPLSSIALIERTTAPLAIQHQEQFPALTISFNVAPHAALGDAVKVISAAEKAINMPATITGSYSGDAAEFSKSLEGQPWLILAAIVTIYIVLGVLYESFIHPFTILTTLPSAGIGAVLALMLTGLDLSLVALIGIILLMGIVKKNAIMMIDFALEAERTQGMTPRDAIFEACLKRFRPIMMTTLAALFGALPLAIESGTGSELRNPLGITIIGGLLLSQLLTLYTTPVIYLAMDRLKARIMGQSVVEPTPHLAPIAPPHSELAPQRLRPAAE
jgi:multidrug efflux pump